MDGLQSGPQLTMITLLLVIVAPLYHYICNMGCNRQFRLLLVLSTPQVLNALDPLFLWQRLIVRDRVLSIPSCNLWDISKLSVIDRFLTDEEKALEGAYLWEAANQVEERNLFLLWGKIRGLRVKLRNESSYSETLIMSMTSSVKWWCSKYYSEWRDGLTICIEQALPLVVPSIPDICHFFYTVKIFGK